MGGTHYIVLRQGGGWIFVTSLDFTMKNYIITTFKGIDILHTSGTAKLRHTGTHALATRGGAPPVQVSIRIIGPLLIVNLTTNSLEIERHSNPKNYCVLFAPSASGD